MSFTISATQLAWEGVVAAYTPHAPFTDETALQLCRAYLKALGGDPANKKEVSRVKKVIKTLT